ncbi:fimbrial biogenesis chaperone [Acinetobacter nosocomialis]|uniref:fimbrial biogenesis chaperone n=1 Tax=Acinetobacter nosocomialis TaxID=106654 RepID=UPI0003B28FAC|nr:fimbria/pilus periplasmic chaperone [Acinetobacter nosocomialis]MBP1485140.1 fimbria/pilus periplasmic chaperone [Acinetobacter nosocomialis]MDH2633364.1 fimbria/pilus periplasmic chaperone [Acinetobacter nosocomialis]OTT93301.1 pilus assembly protein [Acinetobacter nosocomialis]QCP62739.1 molecular chaperone [Acinetobacter nosocomialis M2]
MLFRGRKFFWGMACLQAVLASIGHAEIILHGTRVIYPSDAREVSLQLSNNGTTPSLVQAWIDDGNSKSTPDESNVPFIITPPISRIEPTKGQTLRITALPSASQLNQNKESIFWLNVLDIPPKPEGKKQVNNEPLPNNFLQLAIRSRIKFFYRPANLKENIDTFSEKIQWVKNGEILLIKNPTPFYITMSSIFQEVNHQKIDLLKQGLMLSPFSEDQIKLKNSNITNMSFVYINDYGGRIEQTIKF